ncbi:cobalamin biosynthesis protein [Frankia sp. AgPm24]|uniref:cobalamin biosynthesis protein n=1 Tax=Frankia sp. AgPm24 TaxID=631128 RepID=UPI00200E62A6|nr:cobalamin biosynthesis protein [Frankia sp. AgPm24]MCK9921580.1 cobalamin biosynthesis protein [Frankia sp. AgPm24]
MPSTPPELPEHTGGPTPRGPRTRTPPGNPPPHHSARDLVVGIGARPGVQTREVLALIDHGLRALGASPASVRALATVDVRAREPGLRGAAAHHGWPLIAHPAALLATVDVPHPSAAAAAALGTPSVAEAACQLALPTTSTRPDTVAPSPGRLVLRKQTSPRATLAIARHPSTGCA